MVIEAYHRDLAGEGRHRPETMQDAAKVRGDELADTPESDFANAGKLAEQEIDKHKTASAPGIINPGPNAAMISRWEKVLPDAAAVAAFEKKVAAAQAAIRAAAANARSAAQHFFDECANRALGLTSDEDTPPTPPLRLTAPELVT